MPQDVVQLFQRARELRRKGRAREAIELLNAAQRLAGEDLDLLVPVLSDRGLAERQEGDCEAARRTYADLVRLFEEREGLNPVIFAAVLDNFGFVERECGDLTAAGKHHARAVEVLRDLNEPAELAHALTGLAIVQKDLGLLQQARISITEALLLAPAENRQLVAYIRSVHGLVFQILREWTNARREFVHALAGFRAVGDGENAAVTLHNLATVEYERGRTGTAVRLLRRSMAINDRLEITAGMANDLRRLALYAADAGALPQARALLLRALRAARRTGDRVLEAWCQLDLARVAVHMNQTRETLKRASAAWVRAGEVAAPFLMYEVLRVRGVAGWRRGRLERAVADFETAVAALDRLREGAMTEELSLRFFGEDSDAHANLVQVAIERGDVEAAWQWAERTRGRELNRRIRRSASLMPRNVPSALVAREHDLLRRLDVALAALESQSSSAAAEDVDAAMTTLRQLWDEMKGLDAEYVLMRTGDDISFADLRRDLAGWSTEQSW